MKKKVNAKTLAALDESQMKFLVCCMKTDPLRLIWNEQKKKRNTAEWEKKYIKRTGSYALFSSESERMMMMLIQGDEGGGGRKNEKQEELGEAQPQGKFA